MPAPTRLHAVTREVELPDDVLGGFDPHGFAWLHHGTRLVASGVAARLAPDDAAAVLAAVDADDPLDIPGTGAIAVGALPFDPDAAGELVVPTRVLGVCDGRAWVTEIGPGEPAAARHGCTAHPLPGRGTAHAGGVAGRGRARARGHRRRRPREGGARARGAASKPTPRSTRTRSCAALVASQPGSFVYASEGFVGASPELLVRRNGEVVESRPVAGTTVADSDEALLALAASVKDTREHRFVVDAIVDALGPRCTELHSDAVPEVAVFGPVAHLATPIRGRLAAPAPSALDLARLLHPTPAVGGTPRRAALDAIRELEGFDRGRYAGPVGWVDARGDGEWAIALRGAELDGARARLVAGAGIVAGSDPDAEWAETQAKLEPMLRALVRP